MAVGGVHLSSEISYGQLLQAGLVALGMIAGTVLYVVNHGVQSEDAAKKVDAYQTQTDKRFDEILRQGIATREDLGRAIDLRFANLQGQISGIADMAARLAASERHAAEQDRHLSAIDGRLDDLQKIAVMTQASVAAIERASNQQLSGRR
jgi:hypothetical protein